jgi:hypothetical protein
VEKGLGPSGEPTSSERDIYEVANQLAGYVGPDTEDRLAAFLMRESAAAAALADEVVRLRNQWQTIDSAPGYGGKKHTSTKRFGTATTGTMEISVRP